MISEGKGPCDICVKVNVACRETRPPCGLSVCEWSELGVRGRWGLVLPTSQADRLPLGFLYLVPCVYSFIIYMSLRLSRPKVCCLFKERAVPYSVV